MIWLGIKPTTFRTRGDHTNHYPPRKSHEQHKYDPYWHTTMNNTDCIKKQRMQPPPAKFTFSLRCWSLSWLCAKFEYYKNKMLKVFWQTHKIHVVRQQRTWKLNSTHKKWTQIHETKRWSAAFYDRCTLNCERRSEDPLAKCGHSILSDTIMCWT